MRRVKKPTRSDISLVMASLSLFVALGGTSYAVTKLSKNSVASEQVRDGSLQSRDLAPGVAISGPRGPRGAEGPSGVQGVPGPPGTNASNPAVFRAHSLANQTIPEQFQMKVIFGGEDFDPHDVFDPVSSTFTAPTDGYYFLEGSVETSIANAPRRLLVEITSSRVLATVRGTDAVTTGFQQGSVSGVLRLQKGDTAWFTVLVDSEPAAPANVSGPSPISWFGGYLISTL